MILLVCLAAFTNIAAPRFAMRMVYVDATEKLSLKIKMLQTNHMKLTETLSNELWLMKIDNILVTYCIKVDLNDKYLLRTDII